MLAHSHRFQRPDPEHIQSIGKHDSRAELFQQTLLQPNPELIPYPIPELIPYPIPEYRIN